MKASDSVKYAIRTIGNFHRQSDLPNIFLFATARGGSTWLMEILASQPGMKYYDEPLNIRRPNVAHTGLFPSWASLMPDTGDPERIVRYFNDLTSGRYGYLNPPPFRPNHRLFTNRIVFKIHELPHLMGVLARRCNGQVVYLLRHPVPTTLSRKVFPRLDDFLASAYYNELIGDEARLREIRRIAALDDHLLRGTVAWCYDNFVPLRFADYDGLVVAYEELTLNPARAADLLLTRLHYHDRQSMIDAFNRPSHNINMSSAETQKMMTAADERQRRLYLVNKWLSKVTAQQMADVSSILDLFGIDAYRGDRLLPHPRYLHFPDTAQLVGEMPAASVPQTTAS